MVVHRHGPGRRVGVAVVGRALELDRVEAGLHVRPARHYRGWNGDSVNSSSYDYHFIQLISVRCDKMENWKLPFEYFHSSLVVKTPEAAMTSLQMTPLYGLCG